MHTIYVALSLTHVRTEEEKDSVRRFLAWLRAEFEVEILQWAFDVDR